MSNHLKYIDEKDKSYGLAGVAISIVALDAEEYLDAISIDSPAGECVEFSHDFFFTSNPGFSAKIAWTERFKHFQVTAGMLIANMMCRSYVQHRNKLSSDTIEQLRNIIFDEGEATCSLEKDETDTVFDRSISYFDRLFSYAKVHELANNLASTFVSQRRMSAPEIFESLRQLSHF